MPQSSGLSVDAGGTRFVLVLYLVVLGLGLALVPRGAAPFVQPPDAVRGVATVLAGLLLLRAGAFPRGRTYVGQHVLAAVPVVWGVWEGWAVATAPAAVTLGIVAATILVLPFTPRADEVRPWDGRPLPQLLALTLGGIAAAWGAASVVVLSGSVQLATMRGFGIEPVPFWWLAAGLGTAVVVQEFTALPASRRWPLQVACGAVLVTYALLVPLRAPGAYWLLNAATIVRSGAVLALPLLRGRALLETSAYADRLTAALIFAAVAPLAVVVAWVMYVVEDPMVSAAERNTVLGAVLASAVVFSLIARLQARVLTSELRAFSQRVAASVSGARGELVGPHGSRELRQVGERLDELLRELDGRAEERQALLRQLREQNQALSEANAAKDAFLNMVSHELRTPLTILTANARLLSSRGERFDATSVAEAMGDIHEASRRLEDIVDDLLTLARPEQGLGLELQPLRLRALVDEAVGLHRAAFPQRTVCVVELEPQFCEADTSAVVQVMSNLLSNAEKYSPSGEPVEVTIGAAGAQACVVVADRGIGFAAEESSLLFEPFYRSSTAEGYAGGMGIGLAAARRLARAMGGELSARPRVGGGAEFELRLPAMASASE